MELSAWVPDRAVLPELLGGPVGRRRGFGQRFAVHSLHARQVGRRAWSDQQFCVPDVPHWDMELVVWLRFGVELHQLCSRYLERSDRRPDAGYMHAMWHGKMELSMGVER